VNATNWRSKTLLSDNDGRMLPKLADSKFENGTNDEEVELGVPDDFHAQQGKCAH
jgi:hypothetical protein